MAKVLGEPARYVTTQTIKKFQRQMLVLLIGSCILVGISSYIRNFYIVIPTMLAAMWLMNKISGKFERERVSFRKGATGEAMVGQVLERFPDDYNRPVD